MKSRKKIFGSIAFGVIISVTLVACGEVSVTTTTQPPQPNPPQPPIDTNPNQANSAPKPNPQPPVDTNSSLSTPTPKPNQQPPVDTNPSHLNPATKPDPQPKLAEDLDLAIGDLELFKDFKITLTNDKLPPSALINKYKKFPYIFYKDIFKIDKQPKIEDSEIKLNVFSFNDYTGKVEVEVIIEHYNKKAKKVFELQTATNFVDKFNEQTRPKFDLKSNISFKSKGNLDEEYIHENYVLLKSYATNPPLFNKVIIDNIERFGKLDISAKINNMEVPRDLWNFSINNVEIKENKLFIDYEFEVIFEWYDKRYNKGAFNSNVYKGKVKNSKIVIDFNLDPKNIFENVTVKNNFEKGFFYPSWYKYVFEIVRNGTQAERNWLYNFDDDSSEFENFKILNNSFYNSIKTIFDEKFLDIKNKETDFIKHFFNFPKDFNFDEYIVNVGTIANVNDINGTMVLTLAFTKKNTKFAGKPLLTKTYTIRNMNKWKKTDYNYFSLKKKPAIDTQKGINILNSILNDETNYKNKNNIDTYFDTPNKQIHINLTGEISKNINLDNFSNFNLDKMLNLFYKNYKLPIKEFEKRLFPVVWWDPINGIEIKAFSGYIENKKLYITFKYFLKVEGDSTSKEMSQTLIYDVTKKTNNKGNQYYIVN
ncbi:hypothetical protein ACW95P_02800 [Candidatus Mycoplasma pogonae]